MSGNRCPCRLHGSAAEVHGEAAALRAPEPATRIVLPRDATARSVTDPGPGPVRRLLIHPRVPEDAHQHWPAFVNGDLPAEWTVRIPVGIRTVQTAYGPDQRRLPHPLVPAFTAHRVRALAPWTEKTTTMLEDDLVDAAAAAPDGVVGLRKRFASRLPWLTVDARGSRLNEREPASPAPPPVSTWLPAMGRSTAWAPNSPVSKAASPCPRSSPRSPPSNSP
ncbi:cytochrome P450 family protein [Streptomyces nojiriensis]|uniref:hypothetical protein n=1 Tax=Streptomyces nojiriensis TaxID=66374 RepID=UPI003666B567